MWGASSASDWRQVASDDPCITRDRFIGLVDRIAADDESVAAEPGLRVDDGVATDNGRSAGDPPSDIEIAEEHEGAPGELAFNLHGAEDAGGVVDLLSLCDEDVLVEIGARTVVLCPGGGAREQEKQDDAQGSDCSGHHRFFSCRN